MASCSKVESKDIIYAIPAGRSWLIESPNQASLSHPMIRITSSSCYQNCPEWHSCWTFNGKPEIAGQRGWATNDKNRQYLIISFKNGVLANVISILSRTYNYDQSPTNFEIWGSNDSFEYKLLGAFSEPDWEANQEKHFLFTNDDSYHHYKILFNTSNSSIFGISGLNIGKIEN